MTNDYPKLDQIKYILHNKLTGVDVETEDRIGNVHLIPGNNTKKILVKFTASRIKESSKMKVFEFELICFASTDDELADLICEIQNIDTKSISTNKYKRDFTEEDVTINLPNYSCDNHIRVTEVTNFTWISMYAPETISSVTINWDETHGYYNCFFNKFNLDSEDFKIGYEYEATLKLHSGAARVGIEFHIMGIDVDSLGYDNMNEYGTVNEVLTPTTARTDYEGDLSNDTYVELDVSDIINEIVTREKFSWEELCLIAYNIVDDSNQPNFNAWASGGANEETCAVLEITQSIPVCFPHKIEIIDVINRSKFKNKECVIELNASWI